MGPDWPSSCVVTITRCMRLPVRLVGVNDGRWVRAIPSTPNTPPVPSSQGLVPPTPKVGDGQIEAIRLVKIARDTAVKAHTATIITLKAVVVTASDELRGELEPLTDHKLVLACSELDTGGDIADPEVSMRHTLASLAKRYLGLHEEIKTHTSHLKTLTKAAAPRMLERFGI